MTKTLSLPGGAPRVLAPTTTARLADRMLTTFRVVADFLPNGHFGVPSLDILLRLYVAEESAQYLSIGDLNPPGATSAVVTQRWVSALVDEGLIEQRDNLLALSASGYRRVTEMTEAIFKAQRALDPPALPNR